MRRLLLSKTVGGYLLIAAGSVIRMKAPALEDLAYAMILAGSAMVGVSAKQTKDAAHGRT